MLNFKEFIKNYQPYDDIEIADKLSFEQFLDALGDEVYTRDNLVGHITASAFVVNKKRDSVLMAYHLIYDAWAWLGGHADGNKDLLAVATGEALEESGIKKVLALQNVPVDIDVGEVKSHIKRGKRVPMHLHLRVDENAGVKWIRFEDIIKESNEPHYVKIYERIVKKIKENKW